MKSEELKVCSECKEDGLCKICNEIIKGEVLLEESNLNEFLEQLMEK